MTDKTDFKKLNKIMVVLCVCCSSPYLTCYVLYSMAATLFVQPLDLVKNRMQLSGEYTVL